MCRSSWPWLISKNAKIQALLKRATMRAWVILTWMTRLEWSLRRKMTKMKRRKRIESISYFVVLGH